MEQGAPTPEHLTAREVAALFGCSAATVRRWVVAGEIQAIKPFGKHLFPSAQPMIAMHLASKETVGSEEAADVDDSDQVD